MTDRDRVIATMVDLALWGMSNEMDTDSTRRRGQNQSKDTTHTRYATRARAGAGERATLVEFATEASAHDQLPGLVDLRRAE